jgi:SAM-dependent methyltransferase
VVPGGVLRSSYDAVAGAYAEHVGGELAGKPLDRARLDEIAGIPGVVGDLGCGPGHVAAYLAGRGATVVGVDLSVAMVRHAPVPAVAGDLLALPLGDGVLAAAVAFYSLIHLPVGTEVGALTEVRRVLAPGGTLLAAVHVGTETRHLDEWWGVPVSVDFRFFTVDQLTGWLAAAGFTVRAVRERAAYPGVEVDTRRAYVTAVR